MHPPVLLPQRFAMLSLNVLESSPAPSERRGGRLPPWLKRPASGRERQRLHANSARRPPARNRLRERPLPEPARVLVAPDRHVHDPRQRLHAAVRLLLGPKGEPLDVEDDEPERVAEAAVRLGLKHVVITSVTRDDLPDGGADHFAALRPRRARTHAGAAVEVLTPDFLGDPARPSTA